MPNPSRSFFGLKPVVSFVLICGSISAGRNELERMILFSVVDSQRARLRLLPRFWCTGRTFSVFFQTPGRIINTEITVKFILHVSGRLRLPRNKERLFFSGFIRKNRRKNIRYGFFSLFFRGRNDFFSVADYERRYFVTFEIAVMTYAHLMQNSFCGRKGIFLFYNL